MTHLLHMTQEVVVLLTRHRQARIRTRRTSWLPKNWVIRPRTMEQDRDYKTEAYWNKEVAYYQESVSAWMTSRFELDRQIILLSTLAIGLLTQFDDRLAFGLGVWVWCLAAISFTSAIGAMLLNFYLNPSHIEAGIQEKPDKLAKSNHTLSRLDCFGRLTFIVGIILTVAIVAMDVLR